MSAGGTFDEPRAALAVVDGSEPTAPGHVAALRTAADERWYHGETRISTFVRSRLPRKGLSAGDIAPGGGIGREHSP
ncbi:hypothetical protein [Haloarcula argentinensis]|uniref:Uncharacterized protein n=1 Tax=Haloarcula argentinensis TaxID=43776 RepID=A0ABU2F1D8_HALAR|nr:hypothetical protein [Haloarcula argentinensis]EMA19140.1 hypothetical protein C443_16016 [Haloarcula argentinensis DSM 12282]MDS0254369.1 hypothetical protein [Haloarcula argentinensis]